MFECIQNVKRFVSNTNYMNIFVDYLIPYENIIIRDVSRCLHCLVFVAKNNLLRMGSQFKNCFQFMNYHIVTGHTDRCRTNTLKLFASHSKVLWYDFSSHNRIMYTDVFMTMLDKHLIDKERPWSLCFACAKICRKHIFWKYSKIIKAFPADTQKCWHGIFIQKQEKKTSRAHLTLAYPGYPWIRLYGI